MRIKAYHQTIHASIEEGKKTNKQTNKVMRSGKQHATKNPNAIIIKNQTQTGTQKNAAHRPLKPCAASDLDGGVVDSGMSPRTVRLLMLSVIGTVGVLGLAAVGVLRLVGRRVFRLILRLVMGRVFGLLAIGSGLGSGLFAIGSGRRGGLLAIGLLSMWELRLLAVWVLVFVLRNIVLVVMLIPRALFASLLAHGHRVAEAVEGALLLLAAQEHEVASL
jgi:hypothetical protein